MLTTLMTLMTTLPIILPVWKEQPLPSQFLKYERENYRTTAAEIAFQKGAFKSGDPALILQTLRILASVKEVDSAKLIYTYLKSEKGPILRAACLHYLYELPVIEENLKYVEGLLNNQVAEGISAARLYTKFSKVDPKKVIQLLKGTGLDNQISLVQALLKMKPLTAANWIEIYKNDKSLTFKKLALQGLGSAKQDANSIKFIGDILAKGSTPEKAFMAASLVKNPQTSQFFIPMSKEAHASLRHGAAIGMGEVVKPVFESVLIKLSKDKDSEVRKQAIKSLSAYPTDKTIKCLMQSFEDKELLNELAAVKSLMTISAKKEITVLVSSLISAKGKASRRWSAQLLGNLKCENYNAKLEVQIKKETDYHARSQQIYALRRVKHKIDGGFIKVLSKDPSSEVRSELVLYLGKIDEAKYFPIIDDVAMNDLVPRVRWAALTACGNNGSPWFNKTLLKIMLDLDLDAMRPAQDRACACWAAGRIRGLSKEMFDRMRVVMKQPTIPQVQGPMAFDRQALIPILFATVDQHKREPGSTRNWGKWAKHFVFRFREDTKSVSFPRGFHNDYYALQAEKYLNDLPVELENYPRRNVVWKVKKLK